jgi:hypothetical protein
VFIAEAPAATPPAPGRRGAAAASGPRAGRHKNGKFTISRAISLNRTQGKGKTEWVAFPGAVQGSVLRKEGHLGEIRARSGRIPFYLFRFWPLGGVMLDSGKAFETIR